VYWRYDFASMTAEERSSVNYNDAEATRYMLRRKDGPEWQVLLTDEGYESERQRLEKTPKHHLSDLDREKAQKNLELLRSSWHAARDTYQGKLEQQYQIYMQAMAKV
jgi:hypothetical protein